MKGFVNIWGGNAADEDSATKDEDTSETSSVPSEWSGSGNSRSNTSSYLHHSSENSLAQSECSGNARSNTSSYLHRLRSPSTLCSNEYMPDEEAPLSPHAPALELVLDKHSPLSPESDSFSPGSMNKRIDTHQNKTLAAGDSQITMSACLYHHNCFHHCNGCKWRGSEYVVSLGVGWNSRHC